VLLRRKPDAGALLRLAGDGVLLRFAGEQHGKTIVAAGRRLGDAPVSVALLKRFSTSHHLPAKSAGKKKPRIDI
jgi:hypothetical protein